MKTLAQYISILFVKNLLVAVLGLAFLYTFNGILGMILDGKFPLQQILVFNALKFPETLVEMIPPSAMIGTVLTLSSLSRTNELVACYSLGVGLRHVMAIVMSIVFMSCCLSLMVQDRILPPVFRKRTIYYWQEMKGRSDFYIDVKQAKVWYRSGDLIFNLKSFDHVKKAIYGMSVYTFDSEFDLVQVTEAKEALFTTEGWRLKNGTVTLFNPKDHFPLTQKFEEKDLLIAETPKDFQEIEKEVDGLRLKELYRYVEKTRKAGIDTKSHEVTLQYRISLSFIPIIMSLLAVPFAVGKRREGGLGLDLGIGLAVTFVYWLFYSLSLSMGRSGTLHPIVAAWLPSFFFAGLAVVLLTKRKPG